MKISSRYSWDFPPNRVVSAPGRKRVRRVYSPVEASALSVSSSATLGYVACHVSTVVMNARAPTASIDPLTVAGRYTSKFDLSITGGKSVGTPQTIRALGYLRTDPMISQRVVNETAQTLAEIDARFPPP